MTAPNTGNVAEWVLRRSHFRISEKEVLPVVFKARRCRHSNPLSGPSSVPQAFPSTKVGLSDALPVIKGWLIEHAQKIYRVGTMNAKAGSLETPHVLRKGSLRFTVWFEPTAANFTLMIPREKRKPLPGTTEDSTPTFYGYEATPQTLHVVGELDE